MYGPLPVSVRPAVMGYKMMYHGPELISILTNGTPVFQVPVATQMYARKRLIGLQLCCVTSSGPDATWDDSSCGAFEDLVHCAQWKLLDARVVSRSSQQTHSLPLVELFDCSEDGQVGDIVSHVRKQNVILH